MIIGDLRPGVCYPGKQGGFSDVREAHQAHIRDDLQLQCHVQLLGRLAGLCVFGYLHGGCGKMLIAQAASAALQNDLPPVVAGHVRNHLAACLFPDDGSLRYF